MKIAEVYQMKSIMIKIKVKLAKSRQQRTFEELHGLALIK